MERSTLDKRQFPRIVANFPIRITPEFLGETADLSETGLKFVLDKPLLLSKAPARIEISPKESIDAEFKVIWNKHLVKENKFTYGVCFIRLKERDLSILRSILIESHSKSIFDKVQTTKAQERIKDFWSKDFKEYLEKLVKISDLLESKGINKEEAIKQVTDINDAIVQKGDGLEAFLNNKTLVNKIKHTFRALCGPWVYRSKIVKHAFEKPRGFPGDLELLEIIYNNRPISENIGYCYDKYFLNNKYAIAVRNRKNKMKEILADFICNTEPPSIKILNLACGSCRELSELFANEGFSSNKDIGFALVDQDEQAITFSKEIFKKFPKRLSFKFFQHNIIDYGNSKINYSGMLGKQNLIYSIGLADYLPDRVLRNLISFCFSLLESGGKLIIAHKDVNKYKPLPSDWWCDWTFYPRDESYLLNLITKSNIKDFDIKVEREPSNIILFLTIQKL